MKYTIAFKDLPFEPEERQVIYVENLYDERINAIIRDNYERLKWTFERARLDFVYFPMFFDDEEIREKVLYYAPYLTNDIIEKAELRSSYLLGYMSHPENSVKISPSFLHTPKKEDNEWILQGKTIDIANDNLSDVMQWFEDFVSEIEEELTSDWRYNEDLDEPVPNDGLICDSPQVEYSSTPQIDGAWLKKKEDERIAREKAEEEERERQRIKKDKSFWEMAFKGLTGFSKKMVEEEDDYYEYSPQTQESTFTLNELRDEDVQETIEDLERNIERLRLLGIPLAAIAEFVAKYETISRIKITDDLRIFLPDYNNLEVKMGALYKAVYFLFINHPEGIILKRLEEYHQELTNYYLQASGKESLTQKMYESINSLEYPGNNYINTIMSKIKMCFKATIDEHLARYYYIYGKPGEPYKIALENINIEWEDDE